MVKRDEKEETKDILKQFLNSKICIWYKDSEEKVIGILNDYDDNHLLVFDEKTKMTIIVKRLDFFKIERWNGGISHE
jgi:small nuclear ribonucleoprotein (snRNP)-like protein